MKTFPHFFDKLKYTPIEIFFHFSLNFPKDWGLETSVELNYRISRKT
jgi:hypothetical protein